MISCEMFYLIFFVSNETLNGNRVQSHHTIRSLLCLFYICAFASNLLLIYLARLLLYTLLQSTAPKADGLNFEIQEDRND
jgi:hypothetical protein